MSRTNNSSLRIGYLNVRSLERHIDGVKVLLHPSHYHFFAVTETMLRPSSPMGPIRVPGYNFVRHSLPTGRGNRARSHGGVGLYVQKGIKAVPIIRSLREPGEDNSTRLEYLAVQSKTYVLLWCTTRPDPIPFLYSITRNCYLTFKNSTSIESIWSVITTLTLQRTISAAMRRPLLAFILSSTSPFYQPPQQG